MREKILFLFPSQQVIGRILTRTLKNISASSYPLTQILSHCFFFSLYFHIDVFSSHSDSPPRLWVCWEWIMKTTCIFLGSHNWGSQQLSVNFAKNTCNLRETTLMICGNMSILHFFLPSSIGVTSLLHWTECTYVKNTCNLRETALMICENMYFPGSLFWNSKHCITLTSLR